MSSIIAYNFEQCIYSQQDVSNNKVAPDTRCVINKPTIIGPLECTRLKPTIIDCSNSLWEKWHKLYPGTTVGEPGQTMTRNPHRNRY